MILIKKATITDFASIVEIGNIAVLDAHKESATATEMQEYLKNNYCKEVIRQELEDANNLYYLIYYNGIVAGFSKIILNAEQPDIAQENISKLDRIYLLQEFYDLKLGYELLKSNIQFCKENHQNGIWLYTWVGNERAIQFYLKAGFTLEGSNEFKVTETRYNEIHLMFMNFKKEELNKLL